MLARILPWLALLLAAPLAAADGTGPVSPADLVITPDRETAPVVSGDDAADDAAIWVDRLRPGASLVIGTDKQDGLMVYDLHGRVLQRLSLGRLNNVDLRQGVTLGPWRGDLVVASDRTHRRVVFLAVDPRLRRLRVLGFAPPGVERPYGICMHRGPLGVQVFVTSKSGHLHQLQVTGAAPRGGVTSRPVATAQLPSQLEGCVADDATGALYVGEEAGGVWRMPVWDLEARELAAPVGDATGLRPDVEGLAIYRRGPGQAWLLASSQGDDSFVVFRMGAGLEPLGKFRITAAPGRGIDGVTETDGLEVTPVPLGPAFPRGLLVVQDDRNDPGPANQNFKLVDWRRLAPLLAPAARPVGAP